MHHITTSTEPIRGKLIRISQYIPELGNDDYLRDVYNEFGRQLAHRLTGAEIDPTVFLSQALFLIFDLETGVSGYRGEPMDSSLAGHPPIIYDLLRGNVLRIAELSTPQEFAREVKESYTHLQAKLKEKQ